MALHPSYKRGRHGLHVVALKNYSGHDTPVSSSVVNEKGIVVSFMPSQAS